MRLELGGGEQRNVHRHLVTVKVGVKRAANQRVQTYRIAFDEDRLKRLDPKPVKCGRTIKQDGVILNNIFQNVPDLFLTLGDSALGRLDGVRNIALFKQVNYKGLKKFQGHALG